MLRLIPPMRVRRRSLVSVAAASFLAGVVLSRFWQMEDAVWLWLLVPPLIINLAKQTFPSVLLVMLLATGVGWVHGSQAIQRLAVYSVLAQQKSVTLVGTARSDAVYGTRYQLTFEMGDAMLLSSKNTALPGALTIAGFGAPAILKGDRITVSGKLYQARGNNVAGISFGTLQVVARHVSPLDSMRRRFVAGLQTALPEPQASFGLGLLVGQRNTLPTPVAQALLMIGLTHIIAVSGYNLTIMVRVAMRMFERRSKFQCFCASAGLMIAFLLIAGTSPSIIRAAAVSGLSLGAWYYGRKVKPVGLLLVSAAITAYLNPAFVWGNVTWYLSFLAFVGILLVAPAVTRRIYGVREPRILMQLIIECLCAEAMTMPYVLHIFGQTSLVALPANLLIATLVPLAMLLAVIAGLAGMLIMPLVGWFAWPAKLVLTCMLDIAHILSNIPHAFVEHLRFSTQQMIASYLIVAFLTLIWWHHGRGNAIITDNKPIELKQTEGA